MTDLARTRPESFFSDRFSITSDLMERVLGGNLIGKVDDADIYLEYRINEDLVLEEGAVKKASRHVSQGAGVRAQSGTRTGYAHTDEISIKNLEEAARQARAIADRSASSGNLALPGRGRPHDLYALAEPPIAAELARKLDLLRKIDAETRAADPRIKQVIASIASEEVIMLIATASGWTVGDIRPLTRLNVTAIAEDGAKREIGSYGGGGRVTFDFYLQEERWRRFAAEAARQAVLKLSAVDAPAGAMTVVFGPGWPGILLHEAIGHGLEGDFNRKGTSAFAGRMGQKVASELVTVVDDGTIANRRGSLNVDDEGTPTGRTVLIENGILTGYMQDRLNARLMGMKPTGNGRRESYAYAPMPRMTNTFMLAGQDDPQEILKSVKHGLYAVTFGGGQVDITNGKFVFSASEAYLVEDGRITAPVKGATLIGNGPEALTRVSRVGNDLKLDEGVGTCGKDGQSVPVGVGLPTIPHRRHHRRRDRGMTPGAHRSQSTFGPPRGPWTGSRARGAQRDEYVVAEPARAYLRPPSVQAGLEDPATMNTDLLVSVLKRAAQRGATAADGFLVEESHFSASVRMREIENINHSREQRLSLRVFAGRASAAASTSDLSRESLERVVDEATALAKITAEDPHAGLPDPATLISRVPISTSRTRVAICRPRRRSRSRAAPRRRRSRAIRA
jgi:TldD protein